MVNKIAPVVVVLLCSVALVGAGYATIVDLVSTQTDNSQITESGAYLIDVASKSSDLDIKNTGATATDIFDMSLVKSYVRTSEGSTSTSTVQDVKAYFTIFAPSADNGKTVSLKICSDVALTGVTMKITPAGSDSALSMDKNNVLTNSDTTVSNVALNTTYTIVLSGNSTTVPVDNFKVKFTVGSDPASP